MRAPFFISVFISVSSWLVLSWFVNPWIGLITGVLLLTAFITFGASHIRSGFFITSINRIEKNEKKIVLSFDDGPSEYTSNVLKVLKKHNIKAMFFIVGKRIHGNENLLLEMKKDGHIIGNHTWSHDKWFDFWASDRMYMDIEQNSKQLQSITGDEVLYFRPPYGVTNPPLAKALKKTGMIVVGWSFRSLDSVKGAGSSMEKKVLKNVTAGDILLFHDTVKGMPQLLDKLIPELQSKGFKFVLLTK